MFKKIRKRIIDIKSTIIGVVSGIALGIALLLTGCGSTDEAPEEMVRVVEMIDDNGEVIGTKEVSLEADAISEAEEVANRSKRP